MTLSRRCFLAGAGVFFGMPAARAARDILDSDWYVGIIPDTPFNIELINVRKIPPQYLRQDVRLESREPAGTIIVDPANRYLYHVQDRRWAVRYGIAVGREGAAWKVTAIIGRKAKWPTWTPTANMRKRNPKLPVQVKGGPENPLGCRALYLYQNGRDTLYRIHGTNEPWSIGKAASSGCIRMLNENVFELYGSIPNGTKVIVR